MAKRNRTAEKRLDKAARAAKRRRNKKLDDARALARPATQGSESSRRAMFPVPSVRVRRGALRALASRSATAPSSDAAQALSPGPDDPLPGNPTLGL